VPFVTYADFESSLVPESGKVGVVVEHVPSGFCTYTVWVDLEFETEPVLYSGRDCMDALYDHLANEHGRIVAIFKDCRELSPLAAAERERYDRASSCSNCREAFTKDNYEVRHHNHRTGNFVGALCNSCDLQIRSMESDFFIPDFR
jgi:hypothetical protein